MTMCSECCKPWGLILKRGEQPTETGAVEARAELVEVLLTEIWECELEPDDLALIDSRLPQVTPERIVFISEATSAFASEYLNCDPPEGGYWFLLADVDMPYWLLRNRKQRWAYKWDCCNIGHPSNYFPAPTSPSYQEAGDASGRA